MSDPGRKDDLIRLYEEAIDTYGIYLSCSGVLESNEPQAILIKWPDATKAAIDLYLGDPKARAVLVDDLEKLVFEPIDILYQSVSERVMQVLDKAPVGIKNRVAVAYQIKHSDPIKAKKALIDCINELFDALRTMTDINYPAIKKVGAQ